MNHADMTDATGAADDITELPSDISYETLPLLAANPDFIKIAERLRYLKDIKDRIFTDKKDKAGVPVGEWDRLRLEAGALVSVAGVASVVFQDLRIANTKASKGGEPGSGPVEGGLLVAHIRDAWPQSFDTDDLPMHIGDYIELLERIVASAKGFDEEELMQAGVRAHQIAAARGTSTKGRAASTRIEWVGKRGKGAGEKQGYGGSGMVQ